MMAVAIPLIGPAMDLDIPAYYFAIHCKNGIFEITAAGVADPARENYIKPFAGVSDRVSNQVALPQARDKPFRNPHVFTRLRVQRGKKI
jgi:hypothetical protein